MPSPPPQTTEGDAVVAAGQTTGATTQATPGWTVGQPGTGEPIMAAPEHQWKSVWLAFRRSKLGVVGLVILAFLYVIVIFAEFIAPYGPDNQARELQWAPPTGIHFSDENGGSVRPFIYPIRSYIDDDFNVRQEADRLQRCYLKFFAPGDEYRFLGLFRTRVHLFQFEPPTSFGGTHTAVINGQTYYARFYLMGADLSGRDVFSRICYGSRISMTIGLVGSALVLVIGLLVGGISGYVGGLVDGFLQRLCEVIMLLPGFYLLLMLRFLFPSDMSSTKVYFAVVSILALVGWPGLARVIRGMVLSIRGQDYVVAARAMGVKPLRIIARHILPNTSGYVIVSVTLSIPGYILGESALSLLGLGITEPTPSWGNMLQRAMDVIELDQHPWVLWPGAFIFLAVMGFNLMGDALRDALDPKRTNA
jgi:peptide/nickel transport system permease protein